MTIAFSTKTLDWKTKYSFEPNQYMTSGDEMISFPIQNSLSAWQHDTGGYSKFYDTTYSPSFSVVSNEDPSATKIYEAFSIEGSDAPSSVSFSTRTADDQESSTSSFKKMEGKFYSEVPKNSSNIDAALGYVGSTTLGDFRKFLNGGSNKLYLDSRPVRIPNGSLIVYTLSRSLVLDSFSSEDVSSENLNDALLEYKEGVPIAFTYTNSGPLYEEDVLEAVETHIYPQETSPFYVCKDYDPYTNSLSLNTTVSGEDFSATLISNITDALEAVGLNNPSIPDEFPMPLFTFNKPSLSGEDMRGDFMKIDLEFAAGPYFEVYAINVDQHKTKLDHSLGQNN